MTFSRSISLAAILLPLAFVGADTAPPPASQAARPAISNDDTLTVVDAAKQQTKIRLHGIDAPESKQAFGTWAKEALSARVYGKKVRIVRRDVDRYGRTVADVFVDDCHGNHVNLEMVRDGFAWHYMKYAPDDAELTGAEREARAAKRGLWADAAPGAPWEFRRVRKAAAR